MTAGPVRHTVSVVTDSSDASTQGHDAHAPTPSRQTTTGEFGSRSTTDAAIDAAAERLRAARDEVAKVIVGQKGLLDRVLLAAISGGHVLIEGAPGLAKTRTVRSFARVLGGSWQRVQFTPDLVPADLIA